VDRDTEKGLRRKPVVLGVGLLFFLGFLAFWAVGRQIDSVPPSVEIESRILEERAIPTPGASDVNAGGDAEARQGP
jgi:hypothetical protein